MAAGALFGLEAKEPNWTMTKENDFIQITVCLDGIRKADQIQVDIVDGEKLELEVALLYRLIVSLPSKVKDDEKDGVQCMFTKKDATLMMKLPLAVDPPMMDPEEAMMMGMDPDELGLQPAKTTKRRLSIDDAHVARTTAEIVGYFVLKREELGRASCPHIKKHLTQPAGWLDLKLKKLFSQCRCKSRSHGWCCLTCYQVHCASCGDTRTAHYKQTGHGLSMNCKLETWCWECAHDPLDERITPMFVRLFKIKHGKKPADILEVLSLGSRRMMKMIRMQEMKALEEAQGVDLQANVASLLGTSGELGDKFKDYNQRMDGMMKHFDSLIRDLSEAWGDVNEWQGED